MTHTSTYAAIDQTTRTRVKSDLVKVERQPSQTDAYFIPEGRYRVVTANGDCLCEAPVWILWDTSGFPYPITPTEFEKLYKTVP